MVADSGGAVCLAGSGVCAYFARPVAPPTLEAVQPLDDIGEIGQGETKSVEFELVNHYPRNVEIKDVSTTCSCTNVDLTKHLLAPGEKVALKADWRTGASRGKRTTDLFVLFAPEGGAPGRMTLRVQGTVVPDMLYSPDTLDFEKGTSATKSVVFSPGRMPDGELKKAWCTHHAFAATLAPGSHEVAVSFDFGKWTVDDDNLQPGSVGFLQVETTSPHEPVCRIPLVVRERGSGD